MINEEFNRLKSDPNNLISDEELPVLYYPESQSELKELNTNNNFDLWKTRYVSEQLQNTYYSMVLPVTLGDISAHTLRLLSDMLSPLGEDLIRLTPEQNMRLVNIPYAQLPELYQFGKQYFPLSQAPAIIGNTRSCAGASTCRLGICLSRGLTRAIFEHIKDLPKIDRLNGLRIHVSGCPNNCGQHSVADIGFSGFAGRKNGRLFPGYHLHISRSHSALSAKVAALPAARIPDFCRALLELILDRQQSGRSAVDTLHSIDTSDILTLARKYEDIPDFTEDKNPYFDFGADNVFSLVGRGVGECSAGMFDLIDIDREHIREFIKHYRKNKNSETLAKIRYHSERMLLVTRGIEAISENEVKERFIHSFIDSGLVPEKFRALCKSEKDKLNGFASEVLELADHMERLYQNMDDSLQFKIELQSEQTSDNTENAVFKDLRGVKCPMNFVKVKMELSKLKNEDLLKVYLDDGEPIENVPGSVKNEGHEIVRQTQLDNGSWSIVIRKRGG